MTQSDVCLHKSATSAVTSYPGPALSLAATAQWPRAEDATVVSGEKQGGAFLWESLIFPTAFLHTLNSQEPNFSLKFTTITTSFLFY